MTGLSLREEGAYFGPVALLTKTNFGFEPRPLADLGSIIGWATQDSGFDLSRCYGSLRVAARSLNNGDWGKAGVALAHLRLPSIIDTDLTKRLRAAEALWKANFNPDEPRDNRARWTVAGLSPLVGIHSPIVPAAYMGEYHDYFLQSLVDAIIEGGGIAVKSVPIISYTGVTTIADAIVQPRGIPKPYVLEVKTGANPKFTLNQSLVYPYVCFGGHAVASKLGIAEMGLMPLLPLPPLRVLLIRTLGPDAPVFAEDLCRGYGL